MALLPGATLSVDVGGSGIKTLVLDENGQPWGERHRQVTPRPAVPELVVDCIIELAERREEYERVSVGFPGIVIQDVVKTAPNLGKGWSDYPLGRELSVRLDRIVRVANDADIQGLGAIEGKGVELVLTLGTGMGSALFIDGRLVPNLELAHHPFRKKQTYEDYVGRPALKSLGVKRWSRRVARVVEQLDALFSPRRLYLGGGNAKKIAVTLPPHVHKIPNIAGLLGGIRLWLDN